MALVANEVLPIPPEPIMATFADCPSIKKEVTCCRYSSLPKKNVGSGESVVLKSMVLAEILVSHHQLVQVVVAHLLGDSGLGFLGG